MSECGFGLLQAPTIPYLGTFLTDLIMLDTALLDFVEVSISHEKRKDENPFSPGCLSQFSVLSQYSTHLSPTVLTLPGLDFSSVYSL